MSLFRHDGSPAAIRRAVAKAQVKRSMKMLKRPATGSQRWEHLALMGQSTALRT